MVYDDIIIIIKMYFRFIIFEYDDFIELQLRSNPLNTITDIHSSSIDNKRYNLNHYPCIISKFFPLPLIIYFSLIY